MGFEVTHRPEQELISIAYAGPVDIAQRARALAAATALLHATGARRLLIDFGRAQLLPAAPDEIDQHAVNVARHYRALFLLRVAVVGPHGSPTTTTVELLAAVRGYLYQRFPNTQAAEQWLLGPPGVVW